MSLVQSTVTHIALLSHLQAYCVLKSIRIHLVPGSKMYTIIIIH